MKLPTGDQATQAIVKRDLLPLAQDGWAHVVESHPDLAKLFRSLVVARKLSDEQVTGAMLMVGIVLEAEKSAS